MEKVELIGLVFGIVVLTIILRLYCQFKRKNNLSKTGLTELLLIIGVSGSGKSSIAKKLCEKYNFQEIASHTTRDKRKGEKSQFDVSEGERPDYIFVSKTDFQEMVNKGEFIENIEFGGNFYGVHKSRILTSSRIALVVEPEGAKQITKFYENDTSVYLTKIYLNISIETQVKRMLDRGDTQEMIDKRLSFVDIRERAGEINFDLVFNTEKYSADKITSLINSSIEE